MIQLYETGGHGIVLDDQDCIKFIPIFHDPEVQQDFGDWNINHGQGPVALLQLCAAGHGIKYPTLGSWPACTKSWYILQECIQRLKEEGMKISLYNRQGPATVYNTALDASTCNQIIKASLAAYKKIIVILLSSEIGSLIQEVVEKVQQLGDLGEWGTPKAKGNGGNNGNGKHQMSGKICLLHCLKLECLLQKLMEKQLWHYGRSIKLYT